MDRFQNTRQPDWDWWGRLWPTPGETLRELGIESGDSLAEIGSGNGYFALPAARITAPATVYAVDIDSSLLEELSTLADQQAIDNITPIHGDARRVALPESVDAVLIANTFHGIDDTASVLEGAVESLAPGGRCLIVNWTDIPRESCRINGDSRGPPTRLRLSPDETRRRVQDATSLAVKRTVELPPYHYAIVFER